MLNGIPSRPRQPRCPSTLATSATLAALASLMAVAPTLHAQGTGTLQGIVRDTSGNLLANVEVALDRTSARTLTSRAGQYVITRVPEGRVVLTFRRL
jgi:hypothetical protein